jgi:hypothetical protein
MPDSADYVVKDARLSADRKYRYTLDRHWGDGPVAWWIMLNPSTADALVDDPTIRRCISFSKREGCGSLRVINLYALRATDPTELARSPYPQGADNSALLVEASYAARAGALVVVAWGAHPMAAKGAGSVERMFQAAGAKCLGITKAGQPRHPLYVRNDQPLVAWRWGTHIDGDESS